MIVMSSRWWRWVLSHDSDVIKVVEVGTES